MAYQIKQVEGVGPKYTAALAEQGVTRTDHLLDNASTKAKRKQLAAATGIPEGRILEFANRADLMRIHRVGPQFADLLERAGVDTVKELARRNPTNLKKALERARRTSGTTASVPGIYVVAEWVDEAAGLTPLIRH